MGESLPEVRCPTCRSNRAVPRTAAYYPFCSKPCRDRDLAAWSREEYRMPGPRLTDDDAEETPAE